MKLLINAQILNTNFSVFDTTYLIRVSTLGMLGLYIGTIHTDLAIYERKHVKGINCIHFSLLIQERNSG